MDTFEKQFARLSPAAQRRFEQHWGKNPWKDPAKNRPTQRKAWKAELFSSPLPPRWQHQNIHPESPLWMALRARNRRAAHAILDKTGVLSRKEAADCVLLTLQWAPDLLERILDKTPGRPFAWLRHEIALDRQKQLVLSLRGSLVMIAAALNDLSALNILLTRGGQPDYDFRRDRWDIVGDLLMGGVTMGALNSPTYSLYQIELAMPFPDDSSHVLRSADPFSAAIFCNAERCAARLLEEPAVTVTPAVRRALAITPPNDTQAIVAAKLGTPLEEILLPDDFGPEMDHPLLPAVLARNDGKISRKTVEGFVYRYHPGSDETLRTRQLDTFSLMDADMLGDVVWTTWQQDIHRSELLDLVRTFALPVDRCRVSEHLHRDTLLELMDSFCITGEPPEDGLSGLACALLTQLEGSFRTRPMPVEQLLHIPGAVRVLKTEHPHILLAWLAQHEDTIPASQSLPLKNLLDIHKEINYAL